MTANYSEHVDSLQSGLRGRNCPGVGSLVVHRDPAGRTRRPPRESDPTSSDVVGGTSA